MLFKPYHIDQIRDGEKTVTRREWERRQVKPGGVYIAATEMFVSDDEADCYVRVTDVYEQPLGDMDDEDARREGDYETLEDFRDGYERVYGEGSWDPEKVVWVVEFEYVGRSRPEEQTKLVTDGGVDEEPPELGEVMDFPDEPRTDDRRWIVLFEEDYDNVAIDPNGNVGVLVDIEQTGELFRLAGQTLSSLSHRDAEPDEPIRDLIEALEEVLDDE